MDEWGVYWTSWLPRRRFYGDLQHCSARHLTCEMGCNENFCIHIHMTPGIVRPRHTVERFMGRSHHINHTHISDWNGAQFRYCDIFSWMTMTEALLILLIQPAAYHISSQTIYSYWPLYYLHKLLKKNYCNKSKITEFEMIDTKDSSTAYVVMYKMKE